MKFNREIVLAAGLAIMSSLPAWAFEIALGNEENALGIKVTHEIDEPFGKPLPWGPASIRFAGSSLWAADTLKNRIVEFDKNGTFKNALPLQIPEGSTIGDFCFGLYGAKQERAVFVCDADNPSVFAFNQSGQLIGQIGSDTVDVFIRPYRIETFENRFFVLDSGKNEIIEFNSSLKQVKTIKTAAENFAIENNYLAHFINNGRNNLLEWHNLKTGETNILKPGLPGDLEFNFITCNQNNNKGIFIGVTSFKEGEEPQFSIVKYSNKDDKMSRLNTSYPVSFMVRSFIKDKDEKIYQIKFEEDNPNKIIIDEIPENFGDSEG